MYGVYIMEYNKSRLELYHWTRMCIFASAANYKERREPQVIDEKDFLKQIDLWGFQVS